MTARLILTYPNSKLRRDSLPVNFNDPQDTEKLISWVEDIRHTMSVNGGVGLAAPQVDILKRIFVVDASSLQHPAQFDQEITKGTLTFINSIVSRIDEPLRSPEGCLSVPGVTYNVERYRIIDISYQDIDGKSHHCRIFGDDAVVIQHEQDHFEGRLFIDKISSIDRAHFKKLMKKEQPRKEMSEEQLIALRDSNRAKSRAKRKKRK